MYTRAQLEGAFDAFDEDGSGRLSKSEFREILQGTGLGGGELTDGDFEKVMSEVDVDGSGDIDIDEVRSCAWKGFMDSYMYLSKHPSLRRNIYISTWLTLFLSICVMFPFGHSS